MNASQPAIAASIVAVGPARARCGRWARSASRSRHRRRVRRHARTRAVRAGAGLTRTEARRLARQIRQAATGPMWGPVTGAVGRCNRVAWIDLLLFKGLRMDRRSFLHATTGLVGAAAGLTSAQSTSPRRIGYLANGSGATAASQAQALVQGLAALGWHEGGELAVDFRFAEGRPERLAALLGELERARPDVIVVSGPDAIRAALRSPGTTSVVFVLLVDPVALRLRAQPRAPGRQDHRRRVTVRGTHRQAIAASDRSRTRTGASWDVPARRQHAVGCCRSGAGCADPWLDHGAPGRPRRLGFRGRVPAGTQRASGRRPRAAFPIRGRATGPGDRSGGPGTACRPATSSRPMSATAA